MHNYRPITTSRLFNALTIVKDTTITSVVIDLREISGNGVFSLDFLVSGDGVLNIEYLLASTLNGTYHNTGTDIITGAVKTSGPGSDGADILSFDPELAPFMKIQITETGTSADAVLTAWLNIQ